MVNISVVVPVYNEQPSITPFVNRLLPVLSQIDGTHEVIFALDPSTDDTEQMISDLMAVHPQIKLLKLSRRFGQAAATMAGLAHAKGQYVVVIDVDLQDPPELIEKMYQVCHQGVDVAYAKRNSRQGETWLKKRIASLGYKLINRLSDCRIPRDTGDYRMLSRRAVDQIIKLDDHQGFLRGLVAYIGFKQVAILYDRDKRFVGKGNYNRYLGSLTIGFNGLFGYSKRPLALIYLPALLLFGLSLLWAVISLVLALSGHASPSMAEVTIWLICFVSAIQLMGLGLLGEYIGRIYMERDNRPLYIVDKYVEHPTDYS